MSAAQGEHCGVVRGGDGGRIAGVAAAKAVFLDRDGIINVNHGYVHAPEQTDWVPGIFDLCAAARDAGYLLVVVTNQAGIGRGYYSDAAFRHYTQWVHAQFQERGVPLAATYYCPHHPEYGQGAYGRQCHCRKPAPGMLLAAAQDLALDLSASLLIGDSVSDAQAATAAGVPFSLVCGESATTHGGLAMAAKLFL